MPSTETPNNNFLPPYARVIAPYLILSLIVFAAYGNIFDNAFLFDDDLLIKINTYLRGWSHVGDLLTGSTTSGAHIMGGFYRPVQMLLYLFAFHLGDGQPFWFHALNLGLHIANVCFVYKIGAKLGFDAKAAFLGALLWGVHPIHTEAVTYISGTADPLSVFFCLGAIIILLPDFSPRKILTVIPLFLLGLVSKETSVIFPLLVMVCLFYVSPERLKPRTYFRTWPLWVIALVFAYWRTHAAGLDGPQTYGRFYDMPQFADLKVYAEQPIYRIYTFLATLPEYLQLLVWPTNLHMERSFPIQPTFWDWGVMGGVMMIVFAAAHIAYSVKIRRGLELGWGFLWFAAAHAPDTGLLVPMNALFLEHWMYFPSIGLFLGLAQTVFVLTKKSPRAVPVFCSAAALIFAFALSVIWHDPPVFYNNIFKYGERSARARNNLALYYSDNSQLRAAVEQLELGIASSDIYAETQYNLALIIMRLSENKESAAQAIKHLERSLEIQPNFYRSYKTLGEIYEIVLHDKKKADFYYARANELLNQQK
jgi:tetratricopeptide (TPR) repeat protein